MATGPGHAACEQSQMGYDGLSEPALPARRHRGKSEEVAEHGARLESPQILRRRPDRWPGLLLATPQMILVSRVINSPQEGQRFCGTGFRACAISGRSAAASIVRSGTGRV